MKTKRRKILQPPGEGTGQRQKRKQPKERPAWLLPIITFLAALAIIALALFASSQKGR